MIIGNQDLMLPDIYSPTKNLEYHQSYKLHSPSDKQKIPHYNLTIENAFGGRN